MQPWVTVIAVLFLLSACATSPSGAGRSPAALDVGPFSGTWVGTLTSHEMVSASGFVETPARLTLTADGHWTLTGSGGAVASGVARPTARGFVLEGRMTEGDPMAVGRRLSFELAPRGRGAVYADGETFYLGHRINAGLLLGGS